MCSAIFTLCFREESDIFLCDEKGEASEEVYVPREDLMVKELDLIGTAFYMESRSMCYISTIAFFRLDGKRQLMIDPFASKRIHVIDPGEPPYLLEAPPSDFFVNAGSGIVIPFSDHVDPEGQTVFFNIKLR